MNKMFGTANPALEHYDVAGYNLGSLKSKLNINKKRSSLTNQSAKILFKKNLRKSKLSVKNIDLIEGFSAKDLKKKFSITGSKQHVLENMVNDYKKGNLSLSRLPNKSNFDARKLDKEQLNTMLQDYEMIQKRIKENADLNADDLKRKFSVTGSRGKVVEKMVADYKMGKASATGLSVKSKFDPNKLNKEQFNDMLKKYETAQKDRKRISFLEQSKSKFQNMIDEVKNSIPFSGLTKTFFKQ